MRDALLTCDNLTVGYGGCPVVEGISLQLQAGELLGIIGANGAGKSTVLDAWAGLLSPLSGNVVLAGNKSPAQTLAYLEQSAQCHWPITVQEVVLMGRIPHRAVWQSYTADDHALADVAMVEADILHLKDRQATSLSVGEQARVALARALCVQPDVLLVDEPVADLDPAHQLSVMELLHSKAQQGLAVAAVLHDLTLAVRFCHRLLLLHNGKMVALGTPEAVLTDAHLRTALAVDVVRGEHNGQSYLLPWQASKATA